MGFLGFQKIVVRFMPTSGTKIKSCGHMASLHEPTKDIQIEFKGRIRLINQWQSNCSLYHYQTWCVVNQLWNFDLMKLKLLKHLSSPIEPITRIMANFYKLWTFQHFVWNHLWRALRSLKFNHRVHNVRRTNGFT